MKKKIYTTGIILILIVIFVLYTQSQFRVKAELVPVKSKIRYSSLNQIIFFNEIFSQYQSIRTGSKLPFSKYKLNLRRIDVFRGHQKGNKPIFHGNEIIFGVWDLLRMMQVKQMDRIQFKFKVNREIQLTLFSIPKSNSLFNHSMVALREVYQNEVPIGKKIFHSDVRLNQKFGTCLVRMPIEAPNGKNGETDAGLVFKIASKSGKQLKFNIDEIVLFNDQADRFRSQLESKYYVYGGAKRRKHKSVFIPVGTRLSYKIPIRNAGKIREGAEIHFDGYLGKINCQKIELMLIANGQKILTKQVGDNLHTNASLIPFDLKYLQKGNILNLEIIVNGSEGGMCVLGNMNIYRRFKKKKNVVLYLIDALRADLGGIESDPFAKHFKNGTVFKNVYSNGTRTIDSIPTIFSGKFKYTLVGKDSSKAVYVDDSELLLGEYFKSKGYMTAAFINNPNLDISNSIQGFDMVNHCWNPVKKGSYLPSMSDYMNLKYGNLKTQLEAFIKKNRDKPVFIFIHTMEPHVPYEPPLEMRRYSSKAQRPVLKTLYHHISPLPCYHRLNNPDKLHLDTLKNLYRDSVDASYRYFSKIEGLLNSNGVLNDESLLILTSDHGERFYEHRSWTHGPPDVYNEVLQIPMMIRGEKFKAGSVKAPVQLADLFPSIIDWMGDQLTPEIHGRSLVGILENTRQLNDLKNRWIYVDGTSDEPQFAMIRNGVKLIRVNNHYEKYDLTIDPFEKHNLFLFDNDRKLVEEATRYRKRIRRIRKKAQKTRELSDEEKKRLRTLGYIN